MIQPQFLAESFRDISEVESVYVSQDRKIIDVCLFVNQANEAVYHRIYEREIELERNYPRTLFDFRIIDRRNRPIEEFAGTLAPTWTRSRER